MADLITRLKADVSNHNKGFSSAQKAISNYANSATSLDGVVKGAIGTLSKYVTATAAVTAALKVSKDAFFANEQNLDEWGRTVESTQAIYDGFLKALNTGDISGYLSNIDRIVSAAREAYNAMDELGTYNAFNQRNVIKQRAAFQNAINDYREGKGSKNDVIKAGNAVIKSLQTRSSKEEDAYLKKIAEVAAKNNVSAKSLQNILMGDYASYNKAKSVMPTGKETRTVVGSGGMFGSTQTTTVAVAQNDAERMGQALRMFNDTELDAIQKIGAQQAQTAVEAETVRRQIIRATQAKVGGSGGSGGSGGGKGGKVTKVAEPVIDPTAYLPEDISEITNALRVYADQWGESIASTLKDSISEGLTTLPESVNKGLESVNDAFAESLANARNDVMVKQAQETQAAWQNAASAMSSVGSALQSIEDPGAKVAGILAQAVASVMAGFATALAAPANSAGGVWSWIAAAAAGMATAVATVAEIKSVGQYADGGVIGGNSYVGDKLFARVNSGETILNASEAQRALDMMDAPGGRFGGGNSTISGEQIVTVINNYGRRTGRGEILR